MPDRSSAANEHALIAEVTAPLSTLPDDPVSFTADVNFPIVLRGYDRLAVDAYVRRTSQLVAELQATRSPEAAVRRALERVGDEIAGVLQRAHETAEDITARSRSDAEDRLEIARREATEIVSSAEQRVHELDEETERIWAERHRIVDDARELAAQLLALAQSAVERFPPDTEESEELPREEEEPEVFSGGEAEPVGFSEGKPEPEVFSGGEPEAVEFSGGEAEPEGLSGAEPEPVGFSGAEPEPEAFSGAESEPEAVSRPGDAEPEAVGPTEPGAADTPDPVAVVGPAMGARPAPHLIYESDDTEPTVEDRDDTEPTVEADPEATAPFPRLPREEDDTLEDER
jgi:hypothetical protein